jgi:predicted amidophosphoribosyltransferase
MPRLEEPFCEICANPGTDGICGWCLDKEPEIDQIRAPYLYLATSPIHKAITLLKYRGIRALAPELADLLIRYMEDSPARFDCIAPVVSHPSRIRRRGYSQAALIASDLGRNLDIPVLEGALTRVRNAPSQLSTRSREQRWNNVQANFTSQHDLSGLVILLVDDLVTTGSTAASAAHALKEAGALGVFCIAVARATSRPQRV